MSILFEFMDFMFVGPIVENDTGHKGIAYIKNGSHWFYKLEYIKPWYTK